MATETGNGEPPLDSRYRLPRDLGAPVDIASLVAFRVAFGALMAMAIGRCFAYGWIDDLFVHPTYFFTYEGLEWVRPLPSPWMHVLFAALAVCALGIATGAFYRASALLFTAAFTYVHLIDKTNYLNHYYLASLLGLLLAFLPAHRSFSIDVWRSPRLRRGTVAIGALWLLRFQLAVVYLFGAVAKLNADWLLDARPLRIWLAWRADLPWVGPLLESLPVAYFFSYAGLAFDTAIVPLLLWRRTRVFAYVAVLAFHLLTWVLFPIGMFPWLMIFLTPVFFAPSWPRRLAIRLGVAAPAAASPARDLGLRQPWRRRLGVAMAVAYVLLQVLLPLRHLGQEGDLHWTERGFRFAWQIMVMEKYGETTFSVRDRQTGDSWHVDPRQSLSAAQTRMMATQPDMIHAFAREIAARNQRRGGHPLEVRADSWVSLNGRPHRRLIDPAQDLAAADPLPATWILPPG